MSIILYSFNIYLKNPENKWSTSGTGTVAIQWDTMVTVYGSNLDDAMKNIPEECEKYSIVRVDYPTGYPNFPIFPPSVSPAGSVGVDSNGNHFLRKV